MTTYGVPYQIVQYLGPIKNKASILNVDKSSEKPYYTKNTH